VASGAARGPRPTDAPPAAASPGGPVRSAAAK
jgi:hypothetical protein